VHKVVHNRLVEFKDNSRLKETLEIDHLDVFTPTIASKINTRLKFAPKQLLRAQFRNLFCKRHNFGHYSNFLALSRALKRWNKVSEIIEGYSSSHRLAEDTINNHKFTF